MAESETSRGKPSIAGGGHKQSTGEAVRRKSTVSGAESVKAPKSESDEDDDENSEDEEDSEEDEFYEDGEEDDEEEDDEEEDAEKEDGDGEETAVVTPEEGEEGEAPTKKKKKKKKKKATLKDLKKELSRVLVESPKPMEPTFDPETFPPSYTADSDEVCKSETLMGIIKRSLRQFRELYFDRLPLFLRPLNECHKKRLVMTTINPTQMKYKDLINWPDIAHFVSGYLDYSKLRPPHKLPDKMYAPQTVLELKRGHCFEYSTVLCSMLIGSGYDAYVVSGYATKEVCDMDLSYTRCPIEEQDHNVYPAAMTVKICKYSVKPPKSLQSEYVLRMQTKAKYAEKTEEHEQRRKQSKERHVLEAPPPDPIRGWRVHSWVVVLAGPRDVKRTFFIEPTSGTAHPTTWDQYLGIESLWNNRNYYINVHREVVDARVPVTKLVVVKPFLFPPSRMSFDIGDSCNWDYLFQWQDLHRAKTQAEAKSEQTPQGPDYLEEKFYDLPSSWTRKMRIPWEDYYLQFPTGKKVTRYKKSTLFKWAEYLQPNGMVAKLWVYHDLKCLHLHYSKEDFKNRVDHLKTRYFEQDTGKIIEHFNVGRPDFLKEHHYYAHTPGPRTTRVIVYDECKRTDELYRKEEGPDYIRLYFGEANQHRKYYKEVVFGPNGFVREHQQYINNLTEPRPIEAITECYRRNPALPANEDIHKIVFSTVADDISINYHVKEERIVGSTRHFRKPERWWDESQILTWAPELHKCFEIEPYTRPRSELSLFQELVRHMFREAVTRNFTRISEKETNSLLKVRAREEDNVKLEKAYSLAHQNAATRKARLEEKSRAKYARWLSKQDILRDYLEPNIRRLGLDKVVSKKQAVKVKEDCLADLRDRLITQTNAMKDDFEREKKKIVAMQMWYHDNFIRLSREEEEQYRADIMKNMFVAHVIEQRITTFKEYAPVKYQLLIDTIVRDSRMEPFLI